MKNSKKEESRRESAKELRAEEMRRMFSMMLNIPPAEELEVDLEEDTEEDELPESDMIKDLIASSLEMLTDSTESEKEHFASGFREGFFIACDTVVRTVHSMCTGEILEYDNEE